MSAQIFQPSTALPVVFGAMTIGTAGTEGARTTTAKDTDEILSVFQSHGHHLIDTARVYCAGSSEAYLGEAGWQSRGLKVSTKLYPSKRMLKVLQAMNPKGTQIYPMDPYDLSADDVRLGMERSLTALKTDRVDIWYLHGPDRETPIEETLRAADALYREGRFARLGISNYMAWEVAAMCELAERNGWVRPTVYQGVYHALHRAIEPELLPCLRKYGIALYSFSPLAGGLLTGRYDRSMLAPAPAAPVAEGNVQQTAPAGAAGAPTAIEPGSRYDPSRVMGQTHQARYFRREYFDALDRIRPAAERHGLTVAECALRWIVHHSKQERDLGDAVIVGASNPKYLEQNLLDLEKGPLPEGVVAAIDEGYAMLRGVVPLYHH